MRLELSPPMVVPSRSAAERLEPSTIFAPGRNVWRVAEARRAAVLIDGAAYFAALREAMKQARRSIAIVGWDIHSRTRLIGDAAPQDGLPETLGALLRALVLARPRLSVKLLLWDYSLLYALERELLPTVALQWSTPRQIELCLDDVLPFGASHHQKIVVIDDALAFVGGLDLTVRRWDRSAHDPLDPLRVDPAGVRYPPFHDVQMMLDGGAAAALGELVRERWRRATGENFRPSVIPNATGPWPSHVIADFRNVALGISRTRAPYRGAPAVREIEALLVDMIGAAERWLYIETQFLTSSTVAAALIAALERRPALEVMILGPNVHHTWLEHQTMQAARARLIARLRAADRNDRIRLLYPRVERNGIGADVMIHSKLIIADDRLLRIGSANLCNRSMGTDTECDVAIEARTPHDRRRIRAVLARLLAEHCGRCTREAAAVLDRTDSIFAVVDALRDHGCRLRPIDASPADDARSAIEAVADPPEPLVNDDGEAFVRGPARGGWMLAAAVAGIVLLLVVGWRYTGLAAWARPARLGSLFAGLQQGSLGVLSVIALFVLGGLVAFPVTVMIAAAGATFGAWPGIAYAFTGALASAAATYSLGRLLGPPALRSLLGPRLGRIERRVARRGVVAVAAVRLVPIAPFTLLNLVAGAIRINFTDYLLGTALGLAPGLLVLCGLGARLIAIVMHPTFASALALIGGIAAWIALSIALQRLVSHRGTSPDDA